MRKHHCPILLLIFLLVSLLLASCGLHSPDTKSCEIDPSFSQESSRIVLLPLDSRPACTDLPKRLAHIGNIELVIPPDEILDHYHQPADRDALRRWLTVEASRTDTMILSADMLLHGSLLHSRKNELTDDDVTSMIDFLRMLRQEHPTLRLYVFHTIPRLLIADDKDTEEYQSDMLTYSTLQEEVLLFGQVEQLEDLQELEKDIPQEVRDRYHRLYTRNLHTNEALFALVEDGTIDYLAIGQDDGHIFGLPNLVKHQLDRRLHRTPTLADRIEIVRGADELAMLLVSRITLEQSDPLSVYIAYSDEDTGSIVMPFMSQSVNTTVDEKLASVNALRAQTIDESDFVLYLYIGDDASNTLLPRKAVDELRRYDAMDKPIALVDLSQHFRASETLFPILLSEKFSLHRLIAYAGWNTASNAIGTAVAQASIYVSEMKHAQSSEDRLAIGHANLHFLNDRFLDDYYYMKLVQPYLKLRLSALLTDPYHLSMKSFYEANGWLTNEMQNHADLLASSEAYRMPFILPLSDIKEPLTVSRLTVESSLPWERTFEAKITSKILLKKLKKSVDTTR